MIILSMDKSLNKLIAKIIHSKKISLNSKNKIKDNISNLLLWQDNKNRKKYIY
jgi:hypothetical protein